VDGRLVLNTSALILNAALAGFGLTYLIELQVRKHLDSGELGRVLVNWCPPSPPFIPFLWRRETLRSNAIDALPPSLF
jgi:DNA-binding transcriptional LysR family regulator